ncbi:hypothetical protein CTM88_19390 [Photobacterium aquimaris]|uniref:Uncharacterized protein n=1 Tax=Photobacterium aquimaris TaxID=512643 RepID=A0A2T3IF07_9GAMM|nr:hypothetical protein [Photobacterium aquimaris]OBU19252.1 hypothetical protein AYY20_04650 [Photobacterium aquimaris]PSU23979.1 hypothetical protein CTM88_19390 [Photobacterium aquimaris]
MDFITSSILGGIVYDLVKFCAPITIKNIGMKITDSLGINETISSAISNELVKLDYSNCKNSEDITSIIEQSIAIQAELDKLNTRPSINNNVHIHNNTGQVITGSTINGGVSFINSQAPEKS